VLTAAAGFSAGHDLGVRTHESAQKLRVLVVYIGDLFAAKNARFVGWYWRWHWLIDWLMV
jgi:hypothetical protein